MVRQRDVEKPIGAFHLKQFMMKLQAESLPSSQPINRFELFQGREVEVDVAVVPAVASPTSAKPSTPVTKGKTCKAGEEAILEEQP